MEDVDHAGPVFGHLFVIGREGVREIELVLRNNVVVIGRDPNSDIRLKSNHVSRTHAEVHAEPGGSVYVTSLGAVPVRVNDEEVPTGTSRELFTGDKIFVGIEEARVREILFEGEDETVVLNREARPPFRPHQSSCAGPASPKGGWVSEDDVGKEDVPVNLAHALGAHARAPPPPPPPPPGALAAPRARIPAPPQAACPAPPAAPSGPRAFVPDAAQLRSLKAGLRKVGAPRAGAREEEAGASATSLPAPARPAASPAPAPRPPSRTPRSAARARAPYSRGTPEGAAVEATVQLLVRRSSRGAASGGPVWVEDETAALAQWGMGGEGLGGGEGLSGQQGLMSQQGSISQQGLMSQQNSISQQGLTSPIAQQTPSQLPRSSARPPASTPGLRRTPGVPGSARTGRRAAGGGEAGLPPAPASTPATLAPAQEKAPGGGRAVDAHALAATLCELAGERELTLRVPLSLARAVLGEGPAAEAEVELDAELAAGPAPARTPARRLSRTSLSRVRDAPRVLLVERSTIEKARREEGGVAEEERAVEGDGAMEDRAMQEQNIEMQAPPAQPSSPSSLLARRAQAAMRAARRLRAQCVALAARARAAQARGARLERALRDVAGRWRRERTARAVAEAALAGAVRGRVEAAGREAEGAWAAAGEGLGAGEGPGEGAAAEADVEMSDAVAWERAGGEALPGAVPRQRVVVCRAGWAPEAPARTARAGDVVVARASEGRCSAPALACRAGRCWVVGRAEASRAALGARRAGECWVVGRGAGSLQDRAEPGVGGGGACDSDVEMEALVEALVEAEADAATSSDEEDDEADACAACRSGEEGDVLILCDACDAGCHLRCADPPLARVPRGEWLCAACAAAAEGGGKRTRGEEEEEAVEAAPPAKRGARGTEAEAEARAETEAEAETKGALKAKAETKGALKAKAEPKAKAELKAQAKAEPKAKAQSKAKAEPKAKAETKAESKAKDVPQAEPKTKAQSKAKDVPRAEPKAKAETKAAPKAKAEPKTKAEPKAKAAPKAEPKTKAAPKAEPKAKAAPKAKAETKGKAAPRAAAEEPAKGKRGRVAEEEVAPPRRTTRARK